MAGEDSGRVFLGAAAIVGLTAFLLGRPGPVETPPPRPGVPPAPPPALAATPPDPTEVSTWLRRDFADSARDSIAMIASLPDPQTSDLAADFDGAIEALQRSAESSRYVLAHQWLPWVRKDGRVEARVDEDAGRPGWLLFRSDESPPHVGALVVLVVAERPGSGIDRPALGRALDLEAELDGRGAGAAGPPQEEAPVRLLGPYYSGTADSLRRGLCEWCASHGQACAERAVTILSGTATRADNKTILEIPAGGACENGAPLHTRFQATVNTDDSLAQGMNAFLWKLSVRPDSRAELTETGTAFGNTFAAQPVGAPAAPEGAAHDPFADPFANPFCVPERVRGNVTPLRRVLQIPFPAHISRLRGDPPALVEASESGVDITPALAADPKRDTEQALEMAFWALRRHGVSHVGVLATLSDDKLFLVRKLRGEAPNMRAYVYEASGVLADKTERRAMDGTLVASSYPLTTSTQLWRRSSNGAQPFPSDAAEGVYNAFAILRAAPRAREQAARLPSLASTVLKDYVFPFAREGEAGPSVWISVVVGGQLWPLAVYRPAWGPYTAAVDPPGRAIDDDRVPLESNGYVWLGLLALALFLVVNALALWPALPGWAGELSRRLRGSPFLVAYRPRPSPPVADLGETVRREGENNLLRPTMFAVSLLVLMGLQAATVCFLPRVQLLWARPRREDLASVTFVAASVLVALAFVRARTLHRQRVEWFIALFAVGAVVAALQLCSFAHAHCLPDGRPLFLYLRFMHPSLGLTPVFPLAVLAGALYVGALFRLRMVRQWFRLREWAVAWAAGPFPGLGQAIDRFANGAAASMRRSLVLGVGAGLVMFAWQILRPRTLEGPAFDFTVALAFGVTFTIAALAIWRAATLWSELSEILRRLALHPMVWAYDHMPDFIVRSFRAPLPLRVHQEVIEAARAEAVRLLASNPAADPRSKSKLITQAPGSQPPSSVATSTRPQETIRALTSDVGWYWTRAGAQPPALQKTEKTKLTGVRIREHYLALCMADTLNAMCDVTRTMLFIGASVVVAAVLAIAIYPFQPAGSLAWIATVAVAALIAVALRVIVGIERDEVLSRIARTTPGRVTGSWALVVRLVGYVIVPLGSLIAAYLPSGAFLRDLFDSMGKLLAR